MNYQAKIRRIMAALAYEDITESANAPGKYTPNGTNYALVIRIPASGEIIGFFDLEHAFYLVRSDLRHSFAYSRKRTEKGTSVSVCKSSERETIMTNPTEPPREVQIALEIVKQHPHTSGEELDALIKDQLGLQSTLVARLWRIQAQDIHNRSANKQKGRFER